jgi:hypothetical protein
MRTATRWVAGTALAWGLLVPALGADALPPPIYFLKQSAPSIGSNIPRRVVTSSAIPLNRRYADLTPEQQELVKSNYEAMRPLDEPPYPENGLLPLFEAVREVQRQLLAEGDLVMFVDVDPQGDGTRVSVIKSPDPQLTRVMANILMKVKYKPAICKGQPCSMGFPLRMSFKVDL